MADLYDLTYPEVQKAFLEVMQGIVDDAMLAEMVKAIEANDLNALVRASGFTPAVLGPILDAIEETYQKAAQATVGEWPQRINTPTGPMIFTFNMRNPAVEESLRNYSSQMITRITDEVRENVRSTLEVGMIRGDNPRTTALNIVGRVNPITKQREGGVVGLTEGQAKWAANAQRYLEQLDAKYLTLTLRDKRFDKIVQRAIDSGKPLSATEVEKLVTAYKSRALKYRGEMIARTEASQAFARAEWDSVAQAIEEGVLERKYVVKWWDDTGDDRTRHTHRVLGQKYGRKKAIPFDEPFISPSGAKMMHPGDKSLGAPATELIACRCRFVTDIDWSKQAQDLKNG